MVRRFMKDETSGTNQPNEGKTTDDDYSDSGYGEGYLARRRANKYAKQESTKEQVQQRKRALELRKEERELRKQEREYEHPIRTRAIRRAEKLIERNLSEGERAVKRAPKEAGKTLKKIVRIQRPVRIRSGFTEGTSGGRTRLPVFAPNQASFAERIALDFGSRPPSEILQTKQPIELFSNKADMLFGESKQLDLGLGSSNGNKKKQVRYY